MMRIDKENINYVLMKFWGEIVYLIITVIYLLLLNNFNHVLLSKFDYDDYFNILFYNNYETILYFLFAFILFLIGAGLIVRRWRKIRYEDLEFEDIILHLIAMVILLILIILIIAFINNPILKAVLICTFILYAYSSN